jgi:mannonate dehydratase
MNDLERQTLGATVMLGLPGSDESFTSAQLLSLLGSYRDIDGGALRENLFAFLREVTPVASDLGMRLAIHPDDPPYPVLGLPRIVSTGDDVRTLLASASDQANGLCFCTGSFGARPDNDIPAMLEEFGERVHFLHLRNTKRDDIGNFFEADHLAGDTDMATVVAAVVKLMARTGRSIPMRPDHGHRMLDDLHKNAYPGYTAIGRLRGLAELRGLELGVCARTLGNR